PNPSSSLSDGVLVFLRLRELPIYSTSLASLSDVLLFFDWAWSASASESDTVMELKACSVVRYKSYNSRGEPAKAAISGAKLLTPGKHAKSADKRLVDDSR